MQIELSERFIAQLQALLEFIAQDSVENALKFERELLARIENLGSMPRKYRQSIHFSDPNIRDFIFKGYVRAIALANPKPISKFIFLC